ncbi:MAG: PEP-CTERM sorting domain-containing protein [Armatimonadota bacterium]|nr:PEP-CTERM sorting domain-containing protein [Armatimonadota bacterium]
MTFPRIAGVSVRWSGEIYPGTWVYWEPNDPYPPIPYYTSYPGSFGVVVCDDQGNWLGVDGVSSGQSEDPWPFSRESLLTPYPIGWDSLLTGRGQLRVTFDGYNPAAVQLAQGGLSSVEILVTVPEPAGLPVLLSGLGALGAALRRRR